MMKERDVFLVDFGLVSKYQRGGVHLEYKPDPRKMHDGTIEYLSRDAHIGVKGRRSDLEVCDILLRTIRKSSSVDDCLLQRNSKSMYLTSVPSGARLQRGPLDERHPALD